MADRLRHLTTVLAASGLLAVVAIFLGYAGRGGPGAAGAALGVALVVANYLVSSLAIAWADTVNPRLVLPVGMSVYLTKVSILFLVVWTVAGNGWAGLLPMSIAMVAAIVVWNAAQIWWTARHPVLPAEPR